MTNGSPQVLTGTRATALYIGALLGPGLLLLPGLAASIAGPASILAWLGLLGVSALLAATFAALAAEVPSAAGAMGYAEAGLGPAAGAVTGWWFLAAVTLGVPTVSIVGASYVTDLAGGGRGATSAVAVAILAAVLVLALAGLRSTTAVQLALVGLLVLAIALAVVGAWPHASAARWEPFAPHGLPAVGRAAAVLMLAFFGWEAVAPLAVRVRSRRVLTWVIAAAFALTAVIYVALAVLTISVLPADQVAAPSGPVPVADLLAAGFGTAGRTLAAVTAVVVTLGTVNAYLAGATELATALAASATGRDRRLPVAVAASGAVIIAGFGAGLFSTATLISVATALLVAVYLTSTAAATRLLTGRRRAYAALSLLAVIAVLAFTGWALLTPAGVALVALAYRAARPGRSAAADPRRPGGEPHAAVAAAYGADAVRAADQAGDRVGADLTPPG